MFDFVKKIFPKRCLGIDIGTRFIKIVEIKRFGSKKTLENYGQISSAGLYQKGDLFSSQGAADLIMSVIRETKIKAERAVFSIPDFSTFFTNIELPPMSKEELSQAVQYEARRYVPLPMEKVTLDWQIIENGELPGSLKILLMAVPNEIVAKYEEVSNLSYLRITSLEAETFSLMRSLVGGETKEPVVLIDIGAKSTICSVADGKSLKYSHSLNMSGDAFTSAIENKLEIGTAESEEMKKKYGIMDNPADKSSYFTRKTILPLVNRGLEEIKEILEDFHRKEGKDVGKIIIAGGSAALPGLRDHFERSLNRKVEIGNPFSGISYPLILENVVSKMSPEFAVAVGSALRGVEY